MAARKQYLLRVDPELWADVERWAADELRSANAQVEWILRGAVRRRRRSQEPHQPPPVDQPRVEPIGDGHGVPEVVTQRLCGIVGGDAPREEQGMEQIAPGIHRWTAPHPTWRTSIEDVVSYALVDDDALVIVDPQLPTTDGPSRALLLARLDELTAAATRLELLITIPYHVRSVESLYERYWAGLPTCIWGHGGVKQRLTRHAPLQTIPPTPAGTAVEIADGSALAFAIGKPRRSETPLYFPNLRTVAFGDAVVGTQGGLRFWNQSSSAGAEWYRDVFSATLRPLLERDIENVLVAHGPCVIGEGRRALEECLAADPVGMY